MTFEESHQGIRTPSATSNWSPLRWHTVLAVLTLAVLVVHGYHPFSEDGGLYAAGIEWKLDPTLFPHDTAFVQEHLRFSLFAPLTAALGRATHTSLAWVLLLLELASIWLTLYATRAVLQRLVRDDAAQLGGVALLAAWWTLPVAGTSLLLMDPYVTARSLSMPLSLLAAAYALDDWRTSRRSAIASIACLAVAALFHPLMAAYGAAFVVLLRVVSARRWVLLLTIATGIALLLATALQMAAPSEPPSVRVAELSRDYWYIWQWHWFEWIGLVAPIVTIALAARASSERLAGTQSIVRASTALAFIACLVACLFCREAFATHLVARLQPLRCYALIYAMMAATLGAFGTQAALRSRLRAVRWMPVCVLAISAAALGFVQRQTYQTSPQVELPWRMDANPNPWVQAFLWARDNTEKDAVFALDAKYVNMDGEDAQTFRAIAQRSALPDYSKDGGEASIMPSLADRWLAAANAQKDLSQQDDTTRDEHLRSFHPDWMVVRTDAATVHECPYQNALVKICRFPR